MKPEFSPGRIAVPAARPAADDQTTISALRALGDNQEACPPRPIAVRAATPALARDVVQLFYLVILGCSAVAFALGYWLGRHAQ
jgi:hypothetical protein